MVAALAQFKGKAPWLGTVFGSVTTVTKIDIGADFQRRTKYLGPRYLLADIHGPHIYVPLKAG